MQQKQDHAPKLREQHESCESQMNIQTKLTRRVCALIVSVRKRRREM
jgi:hypothetical protein